MWILGLHLKIAIYTLYIPQCQKVMIFDLRMKVSGQI